MKLAPSGLVQFPAHLDCSDFQTLIHHPDMQAEACCDWSNDCAYATGVAMLCTMSAD